MNLTTRFKQFGLLLIAILSYQSAFSQENFIPGYIITNSADTLNGYVDYRNWRHNPDRVSFKTSIDDRATSFRPMDILEFGVEGEIYVSAIVETEISPTATSRLQDNPQLNIKVDTTFLQTLIRGDKSLFYYHKSEVSNFYIKQDSEFTLLIYKRYLRQQNGKRVVFENNGYLGQLNFYLNECESMIPRLEKASYKQKSLTNLFQYYYTCTTSDVTFQKERERIRTEIGVLAGASLTTLSFQVDTQANQVVSEYESSINFSGGLFLKFIVPRNHGKWSINNELLYSSYTITAKKGWYWHENTYSISTIREDYKYINLINFVRYTHPFKQIALFFNGGISNGYAISETNFEIIRSRTFATMGVEEEVTINHSNRIKHGLIMGTGLTRDKFSLEVRYELGIGTSEYNNLDSRTHRYFILLGYVF